MVGQKWLVFSNSNTLRPGAPISQRPGPHWGYQVRRGGCHQIGVPLTNSRVPLYRPDNDGIPQLCCAPHILFHPQHRAERLERKRFQESKVFALLYFKSNAIVPAVGKGQAKGRLLTEIAWVPPTPEQRLERK